MDKRQQKMIGERSELLARDAADQVRSTLLHKIRKADKRVRRETNICIEKHEKRIAREIR